MIEVTFFEELGDFKYHILSIARDSFHQKSRLTFYFFDYPLKFLRTFCFSWGYFYSIESALKKKYQGSSSSPTLTL